MINQNELAAKFVKDLGYKTWALIYDTTDYGKGHQEYFTRYQKENGGEIPGVYGVTSDQQDFTLRFDNTVLLVAGLLLIRLVQMIIRKTKLGMAIRAVSQDEETGRVMGVNFNLVVYVTFAIGSGLAWPPLPVLFTVYTTMN